jgi:hypothetical protein
LVLGLKRSLWSSLGLILMESVVLLLRLRSTMSVLAIVNSSLDGIVHVVGVVHIVQKEETWLVVGMHKAELHLRAGRSQAFPVHKAAMVLIEGVPVLDLLQLLN